MFSNALTTLGIAVAGLIAFATLMSRRKKTTITTPIAADHFRVKGFEATIDRARREISICVQGHARFFRAPFGHLVVEEKVETVAVAHEKCSNRRRGRALPANPRKLLATGRYVASSGWAETVWTQVETGKTRVRLLAVRLPDYYAQRWATWQEEHVHVLTDVMDVSLLNGKARVFQRWLNHHKRELSPDHEALRATWDQKCAELLRACQQQRVHHGNAAEAFETWSFCARPKIAYLVIEANGTAFWASGDTPVLEPIARPRFRSTGNRLIVFSGEENRLFPVPADRLAPLQALQRRGIIQIGYVNHSAIACAVTTPHHFELKPPL